MTARSTTARGRILAVLQKNPTRSYKTPQLAKEANTGRANVVVALRPLLEDGTVERLGRGSATTYMLAAPPAPTDGPLQIAAFSDGDVSVKGGINAEDGSVVYTGAQLAQLMTFLTTPRLPVPVPVPQLSGGLPR